MMPYPPPIVAQSDPSRLAGGRCVALPVGLVPWEPEQERTTVVVKVGYRFDPHAPSPVLELMTEQPGFTVAARSPRRGAGEREVDAPTDLVAVKPEADVLLCGSAHAPQAVERIDARLRIPERLDLAFCTVGPAYIERMPLTSAYLRDRDGATAIPPVGPMQSRRVVPPEERADAYGLTDEEKRAQYQAAIAAIGTGEWKPWEDLGLPPATVGDEPTMAEAAPAPRSAGPSWDDVYPTESVLQQGCQFAAAQLCCTFLDPGSPIELEGLLPGGGRRRLEVPRHQVLVIAEARAHYDVTMAIDTLLIDTDRGLLTLTWRGQVPEDLFARASVRLVVSLVPSDRIPPLVDLYRELPRGCFARAEVPADAAVAPPPRHDAELEVARQMTFDRVPEPLLTLAQYADLSARLMLAPARQDELLARHGLGQTEWMLEQRAWLERVGACLARGELDAVEAYQEMLARKRRELEAGEPKA